MMKLLGILALALMVGGPFFGCSKGGSGGGTPATTPINTDYGYTGGSSLQGVSITPQALTITDESAYETLLMRTGACSSYDCGLYNTSQGAIQIQGYGENANVSVLAIGKTKTLVDIPDWGEFFTGGDLNSYITNRVGYVSMRQVAESSTLDLVNVDYSGNVWNNNEFFRIVEEAGTFGLFLRENNGWIQFASFNINRRY